MDILKPLTSYKNLREASENMKSPKQNKFFFSAKESSERLNSSKISTLYWIHIKNEWDSLIILWKFIYFLKTNFNSIWVYKKHVHV